MSDPLATPAANPSGRSVDSWLARYGDAIAFAWGVAEATLFFVVPDLITTLSAGTRWRRSLRHVGLVIAGSLLGGLTMFAWASTSPNAARDAVADVPFVNAQMFERVARDLDDHGAWGLCMGPTSGTPYKVYAVLSPGRVSPTLFTLVSVPARAERLALTWVQFAVLGWALRRWSKHPTRWLLGIHAAYWLAVYAFYWSRTGVTG